MNDIGDINTAQKAQIEILSLNSINEVSSKLELTKKYIATFRQFRSIIREKLLKLNSEQSIQKTIF